MKNFNYTARDKSGSTKRGSLKAADRNAAMQELSAQGMVPLSITEGQASKTTTRQQVPLRYVILSITILVLGAAIFTWSQLKSRNSSQVANTRTKKVFKTPLGESSKIPEKTNSVDKTLLTNDPRQKGIPETLRKVERTDIPKSEHTQYQQHTNRVVKFAGARTNQPPTGFSSRLDNAINLLVTTPMGMPPPPLLVIPPGEDVKAALERSILVYDTDNPEKIEKKGAVAYAKQMIKDYIAQGGKPNDFIQYYHTQLLNAYEERKASQKIAMDLLKAGDKDGAALYVEEQNKKFTEKGYVPISIRSTLNK